MNFEWTIEPAGYPTGKAESVHPAGSADLYHIWSRCSRGKYAVQIEDTT